MKVHLFFEVYPLGEDCMPKRACFVLDLPTVPANGTQVSVTTGSYEKSSPVPPHYVTGPVTEVEVVHEGSSGETFCMVYATPNPTFLRRFLTDGGGRELAAYVEDNIMAVDFQRAEFAWEEKFRRRFSDEGGEGTPGFDPTN